MNAIQEENLKSTLGQKVFTGNDLMLAIKINTFIVMSASSQDEWPAGVRDSFCRYLITERCPLRSLALSIEANTFGGGMHV